jgi:hypothetical protein
MPILCYYGHNHSLQSRVSLPPSHPSWHPRLLHRLDLAVHRLTVVIESQGTTYYTRTVRYTVVEGLELVKSC